MKKQLKLYILFGRSLNGKHVQETRSTWLIAIITYCKYFLFNFIQNSLLWINGGGLVGLVAATGSARCFRWLAVMLEWVVCFLRPSFIRSRRRRTSWHLHPPPLSLLQLHTVGHGRRRRWAAHAQAWGGRQVDRCGDECCSLQPMIEHCSVQSTTSGLFVEMLIKAAKLVQLVLPQLHWEVKLSLNWSPNVQSVGVARVTFQLQCAARGLFPINWLPSLKLPWQQCSRQFYIHANWALVLTIFMHVSFHSCLDWVIMHLRKVSRTITTLWNDEWRPD